MTTRNENRLWVVNNILFIASVIAFIFLVLFSSYAIYGAIGLVVQFIIWTVMNVFIDFVIDVRTIKETLNNNKNL